MKLKMAIAVLAALVSATSVFADGLADEPDGAGIKLLDNGGFQILAIGTGTYDFDDPDDLLDAQKEGTLKAKAAIAKFMKEDLSTEEGLSEASKKVKTSESDGENQNTSISKTSVKESLAKIHNSAAALLKGVVVLKTQKVPDSGTKGVVRVQVGVSSKTLEAVSRAVEGIGSTPSQGEGAGASSAAAEQNGVAGAGEGDSSGCPDGWITCVGSGSDRYGAVQAALTEGISMVYGESLASDSRMKERSAKMKSNMSIMGKDINMCARMSSKEVQTDTLTKTAGFVKAYRVAQVVEKGGNLEATVYAYIVNPRAGGTVALLVKKPTMSISDRTKLYDIGGGKRKSGAEIADLIKFSIPNGLECAGKFIVMTEESIVSAAKSAGLANAMVAVGTASASELNELGQGLTPDYSLASELSDIKYSSKLTMIKGKKGLQKAYKLTMTLKISLYNDRQSQLVKSEVVKLTLDDEEIKDLLEIDADADLLSAAVAKLAKPLQEMIKGNR